jgi:putative Mn2+ efflux pump MntP
LQLSLTFATAVALAMDAVAVAIVSGLSVPKLQLRDACKMALFFGAFQGVMPLIGYGLGLVAAPWLISYSHWIAFLTLAALGVKMLFESRHVADERVDSPFQTKKLIALAIATSLDALAVGVSFSLLDSGLLATVAIIALVTAALCLPAVWFGARLGKNSAKRAEVFGGVVLLAIAAKILFEGLRATS